MTSDPKLPFSGEPTAVETSGASLSAPSPANGNALPSRTVDSRHTPSVLHLWLRRIGVLLFVFLCATLGVMLMIVPWRPEWSENGFLTPYPVLHEVVASGFVRGVVTGLGLLNVWIGFWEAIRYRED